jgi:hypothetical protein
MLSSRLTTWNCLLGRDHAFVEFRAGRLDHLWLGIELLDAPTGGQRVSPVALDPGRRPVSINARGASDRVPGVSDVEEPIATITTHTVKLFFLRFVRTRVRRVFDGTDLNRKTEEQDRERVFERQDGQDLSGAPNR